MPRIIIIIITINGIVGHRINYQHLFASDQHMEDGYGYHFELLLKRRTFHAPFNKVECMLHIITLSLSLFVFFAENKDPGLFSWSFVLVFSLCIATAGAVFCISCSQCRYGIDRIYLDFLWFFFSSSSFVCSTFLFRDRLINFTIR